MSTDASGVHEISPADGEKDYGAWEAFVGQVKFLTSDETVKD